MTRYIPIYALLTLIAVPAHAADGSDSRSRWFRSLMQPDNPSISCCEEADGYMASLRIDGWKVYARVIGKARESNPVPLGFEVEVPRWKFSRDPNIFDDPVIFLSPGGTVYCLIQSSGV